MSIREKILNANDRRSEEFTSKAWGCTVKVRSISEAERRSLVAECSDEKGVIDNAKFAPALIIATFVDPLNDAPVFEKADRDALAAKDAQSIEEAVAVAMRVCGFTSEATEKN